MKKKLFIMLVMIACLGLGACSERNMNNIDSQSIISNPDISEGNSNTAGEEKENNQEDNATMDPLDKVTQEEIGEYAQEKYESYLEHFFLIFSQKFSSVSQLKQESILFFTLVEMIDEYPREEIPFEYDVSLDAYYVPRSMVNKKVEQYFGISDFDFIDTSRYFPKKDSYTYTLAHGFPILYPQIVSVNRQGSRLIFTVDYTNPEREGNPTMQTLLFTFEEIEAGGRNYLQAVSADNLIEESSSSTNSAPRYSEKDLGLFSLWLPEDSVIESNIVYEDDSELPRKIAEITSIDTISDTESPFAIYDQRYSDAENVSECHFGIYAGKSYSLQKEISEGGMTGFQNTIVYCIESDNNIVVITFFPQRGVGIYEQREEFERILDSIQF